MRESAPVLEHKERTFEDALDEMLREMLAIEADLDRRLAQHARIAELRREYERRFGPAPRR